MRKLQVCVIGAGAAGLAAGRNLKALADDFDFMIFEQCSEVGGTWVYTDKCGVDDHNLPIHSSMYDNLKTNIPKEIMGYPDFDFPHDGFSFTHRTVVLKYLQDYATHFDLYPHIKFHHHVTNVLPEEANGHSRVWKVTVRDVAQDVEEQYQFDAVMVCNGHYATPNIPEINNIKLYTGAISHSHTYRTPYPFKDKSVAVLGAASSGMDISLEISAFAKKIYLCHNLPQPISSQLPVNVEQRSGIQEAKPDGFVLKDGSFIQADAIVFCTGYEYSFPFLDATCRVKLDNNRVEPLYKHIVHQEYPQLGFIGLPFTVIPFPMFHFQSRYFLLVLNKTITLPSLDVMKKETEDDLEMRLHMGMPVKHAHKLASLQWSYFEELCESSNIESLPPVVKGVYDRCEIQRKNLIMFYKKEEYKILGKEEFVHVNKEDCSQPKKITNGCTIKYEFGQC